MITKKNNKNIYLWLFKFCIGLFFIFNVDLVVENVHAFPNSKKKKSLKRNDNASTVKKLTDGEVLLKEISREIIAFETFINRNKKNTTRIQTRSLEILTKIENAYHYYESLPKEWFIRYPDEAPRVLANSRTSLLDYYVYLAAISGTDSISQILKSLGRFTKNFSDEALRRDAFVFEALRNEESIDAKIAAANALLYYKATESDLGSAEGSVFEKSTDTLKSEPVFQSNLRDRPVPIDLAEFIVSAMTSDEAKLKQKGHVLFDTVISHAGMQWPSSVSLENINLLDDSFGQFEEPTDFELIEDKRRYGLSRSKKRAQAREFRTIVKKVYEDKCAISGLVGPTELAHIIPDWGEDTNRIDNAILMSKNEHWFFDRLLLGIEPETKKVVLDDSIKDHPIYAEIHLKKTLSLPVNANYWPNDGLLEYRYALFVLASYYRGHGELPPSKDSNILLIQEMIEMQPEIVRALLGHANMKAFSTALLEFFNSDSEG